MLKYLLAQDMEQNLLVPLNWLAGAKFLQYSHFSTEGRVWRREKQKQRTEQTINMWESRYVIKAELHNTLKLHHHHSTLCCCYAAFKSKSRGGKFHARRPRTKTRGQTWVALFHNVKSCPCYVNVMSRLTSKQGYYFRHMLLKKSSFCLLW